LLGEGVDQLLSHTARLGFFSWLLQTLGFRYIAFRRYSWRSVLCSMLISLKILRSEKKGVYV
jgi:hypothetical protein